MGIEGRGSRPLRRAVYDAESNPAFPADYYSSYIDEIWAANPGLSLIEKPSGNLDHFGETYPDLGLAIYRHVGAAPNTFNEAGHVANLHLFDDPTTFFEAEPENYYAKWLHAHSIGGLASASSVDRYTPYSTWAEPAKAAASIVIAIGF